VHEKRFKVRPRDWSIREVQIAIAAFSRAFFPRPEPLRNLTVFATAFIQRQNLFALEFI
jgi:hypothetical protein